MENEIHIKKKTLREMSYFNTKEERKKKGGERKAGRKKVRCKQEKMERNGYGETNKERDEGGNEDK